MLYVIVYSILMIMFFGSAYLQATSDPSKNEGSRVLLYVTLLCIAGMIGAFAKNPVLPIIEAIVCSFFSIGSLIISESSKYSWDPESKWSIRFFYIAMTIANIYVPFAVM